jgi:iron complex transport system permease protein
LKWALALVALVAMAVLHLLIPLGPLAEAQRVDPGLAWTLLIELRLPRTLLALGYGATLGITGAALQALFANPLASPDITGSSSGAAMGAVFASYWLGLTNPILLALAGALGAGRTR